MNNTMAMQLDDVQIKKGEGWQRFVLILFFACAMGVLEAICVIYLRRLILPTGVDCGQAPLRLGRYVELIREVSTIVMLATVAWLAGSNWRSRLAAFFIMFGVWDVLYYIGLWWLAGWPSGVFQWDCLFLIPKPWYGPVLAPVLISLLFLCCCGMVFLREQAGGVVKVKPTVLGLITAGMIIWYWSFVKDNSVIQADGYAAVKYSWSLFVCGGACYVAGFIAALGAPGNITRRNE